MSYEDWRLELRHDIFRQMCLATTQMSRKIRDLCRDMIFSDMCAVRRLRKACKIRHLSRDMISSDLCDDSNQPANLKTTRNMISLKNRDLSRDISSDMWAQRRLRSVCKIRDLSRDMISSDMCAQRRLRSVCKIRDWRRDIISSDMCAQRRLRSACRIRD